MGENTPLAAHAMRWGMVMCGMRRGGAPSQRHLRSQEGLPVRRGVSPARAWWVNRTTPSVEVGVNSVAEAAAA